MMSPTRIRGSSDEYGSWRTTWTRCRCACSALPFSVKGSRPAIMTVPAVGVTMPITTCAIVDLPDPVPPTRPRVLPRSMTRSTSSTARTIRVPFLNRLPLTSKSTVSPWMLDEGVRVSHDRRCGGRCLGRGHEIHPSGSVPKHRAA